MSGNANDTRCRERRTRPTEASSFVQGLEVVRRPHTLTRYVSAPPLFGDEEVVDDEVLEALAHALATLHGAGYRHRDLKAPNLLVDRSGSDLTVWVLGLDGARKTIAPCPLEKDERFLVTQTEAWAERRIVRNARKGRPIA